MRLLNKYQQLQVEVIKVDREKRERRVIDTNGLKQSIALLGVMNPIIVDREFLLHAGERRLTSCRELLAEGIAYPGSPNIPCRFVDELSPAEAKLIELEENLKRSDFSWQETCSSIESIHELYVGLDPNWTLKDSAARLGMAESTLSDYRRVQKSISDPRIAEAPTLRAAWNILSRGDRRAMDDFISDVLDAGAQAPMPHAVVAEVDGHSESVVLSPVLELAPVQPESILQTSFLEWAPSYDGPKFNLIHCDFPYGVNLFHAGDRRQQSDHSYSDDPKLYWKLIECLGKNLDNICSHSAHMIFWLSMDWEIYQATRQAFALALPSFEIQSFPLIWLKTDNTGMVPDVNRQPRRIYEGALLASREDRFIIKPLANAYGAPTDKTHHPSTKPVPVLKHFFSMLVDSNTRLLDPTCGSGSALRAAEELGAATVLGLEIDPEHCAQARSALRQSRVLRSASK